MFEQEVGVQPRPKNSGSRRLSAQRLARLLQSALPHTELDQLANRLEQINQPISTEQSDLIMRLTGGRTLSVSERAIQESQALLQYATDRHALLAGALKTHEVARLLGRSRQTVHDRVKARTLLAVDEGGELRFPAWQFTAEGAVVSGLSEVLRALEVTPLSQARWLTRPSASLDGRSPLEALRAGERERVVAEAYAALGAS